MNKLSQQLLCPLNKNNKNKSGQVTLLLISLILILFIFFVIILGNLTSSSLQFNYTFRNFITLRSLIISGLRYAIYQVNQNPTFTTSSAIVSLPQGNFNYSVNDVSSEIKSIVVQGVLNNSFLSRTLKATATINSSGSIIYLEVSEE